MGKYIKIRYDSYARFKQYDNRSNCIAYISLFKNKINLFSRNKYDKNFSATRLV